MKRQFLALTALALCGAVAFAQGGFGGRGGGMRMNPLMKAIDKDGNGELSAAEIAGAAAALKTLDKNKDGKLSKDELPERMQGIIARADTNKDGKLSKDELTKFASSMGGPGGPGGPPR